MFDSDTIWILIPMMALAIPIIAILAAPAKERARQAERKEARKLYERLAMEKLDVLKTAVAMGYSRDELTDLDSRLEKLIGTAQMADLLDKKIPEAPEASDALRDADLQAELDRIRMKKQKQ